MHFFKRLGIYFLFGWGVTASTASALQKQLPNYQILYLQAEKLSNAAQPTNYTDEQALAKYKKVISLLASSNTNAPFLYKTYVSTGAFLQALNRNAESVDYFKKAFKLKANTPAIPDSALFKPLVYCGNSYYTQDRLDSAQKMYDKARIIAEKYPHIDAIERLYNTFGVLAYSTGNYNKSIIYYEKALSILKGNKPVDETLLVTYKSNLASAFRKLRRYNEALKLYKEILPYHFETDKLYHNIGAVYLAMGQNAEAIVWLTKVKYEDQKKSNDLAKAYLGKRDYQKATFFLEQAGELNSQSKQSRLNSNNGITMKYMGDVYALQKQPAKALSYYQRALNNLLLEFSPADIYVNPSNFNSAFNGVEIMETLLAKAHSFDELFAITNHIKDLKAALQSYFAFYSLADHIQRFYETDESRLLISDRKYAVRQQPIAICQKLYALTNNQQYMQQAFLLDEENKANTLSLYRQETTLKAKSGIPEALLNQETALKESITRAVLQASANTDSLQLIKIKRGINENAIKLIAIQNKIKTLSGKQEQSNQTSIAALQQKIPVESAVLSYHIADKSVLCFVISNNNFSFFDQPINSSFRADVATIFRQAQSRTGNTNRTIRQLSQKLYRQLIKPAENLLAGKTNLMIIPDDELNYLPFEILNNEKGSNLMEDYAITYNYSCSILQNTADATGTYVAKLGMAPFDKKIKGSKLSDETWAELPASKKEIEALGGVSVFDLHATKQLFLRDAARYDIIHLATHAYANDKDPDKSFIAFYPTRPDSAISYKLYLPEIYNLKLNKTQLIVLSACESGSGELVNGEGVMSLSRAFAYAGCNNIVTSMWKADDASTAYISAKFHYYLKKGYPLAKALQQAQMAYLNDNAIPPAKKLPGYWAHMRVIGGFAKKAGNHYLLFLLLGLLACCGVLAIKSRGRFKQPRR